MKVALVKPPIKGHSVRGIGFYGQRLYEALKQKIDVSIVDFSYFPVSGFDIVHYPFFDLFWPTLPPLRSCKTVVTLHDVIPLKFPDHFPLGNRAKLIWPWQKFLLKNIDAILTDSHTSKADIKKIVGVESFVTYLAADPTFRPLKLKREDFVLYIGGANWNKNVISLVKACQKINQKLILVGKEFESQPGNHVEQSSLREILKRIQDDKNVIIKGFVETQELVKLYNLAKVYVQPSVYEGFGLPVLEAMSCETPVICGNNSSVAEIAGEAATFVDPTDVDKLAVAIKSVKKTGKELSQSSKFTWENTAVETIKIYEKILGKV